VLNILTVWALTGLWHGAAWNFVVWGLMFAVLLLAEKWIPALQKLPAVVRRVYVLLAVIISFVLFNAESFSQAGADLAGMFGLAGLPFATKATWYYLRSYALLFVAGFIGATPLVRNAARRVEEKGIVKILQPVTLILLLLLCTAYLVDGSFSPFLYFRF
jgi:alginate O-acetyltransferase complex protein AlgI